jgi:hypothetical protein
MEHESKHEERILPCEITVKSPKKMDSYVVFQLKKII